MTCHRFRLDSAPDAAALVILWYWKVYSFTSALGRINTMYAVWTKFWRTQRAKRMSSIYSTSSTSALAWLRLNFPQPPATFIRFAVVKSVASQHLLCRQHLKRIAQMEPCDKETKPAACWVESSPEMLQKELANEKIHYIYIEHQTCWQKWRVKNTL